MGGVTENFVDEESAKSITEFLNASSFSQENGHLVLSVGAPYKYTGSRSSNEAIEIPGILQPLLNRVNELQEEIFYGHYPDYKKYDRPAPPINSILINKYEGPDCHLPKHSDDEDLTHPESSILTASLGAKCTVPFCPKCPSTDDESQINLICIDRSIYRMSRKSQDFFTREIKAGQTQNGTIYSLTFRSVNKWNAKSTSIIVDSNTGRLNIVVIIYGYDMKKFFGERFPGHRFWAPVVEEINSSVCALYSNVVLLCGINNIKKADTRDHNALNSIYEQLIVKVKEIRNSRCKIHVCPILPTKNFEWDQGAMYINKLFFIDLVQKDLGVQDIC